MDTGYMVLSLQKKAIVLTTTNFFSTPRQPGSRVGHKHEDLSFDRRDNAAGAAYPLQARSMVVLMERRGNGKREESNEAPS